MAKTLRDLVEGYAPDPLPTLQDHAAGYHTYYDPQGKSPYGHLPGDELEQVAEFEMDGPVSAERMLGKDFHLGTQGAPVNPMPELGNALDVARALRSGEIPMDREREVREYLASYQAFVGQTLYDPQHHVAAVPEDNTVPVYSGSDSWGKR